MKLRIYHVYLLIFCALSMWNKVALAEGNRRSNYQETIASAQIDGHTFALVHENLVTSQTACLDFGGVFPVFFARQREFVTLDGVAVDDVVAQTGWTPVRDNFEHCIPILEPGRQWGTNDEYFFEVSSAFQRNGNIVQVTLHQHGGTECQPDTDQCRFSFNRQKTLSVVMTQQNIPNGPGTCVPGSGVCCSWDGQLRSSTNICENAIHESRSCSGGEEHRFGDRFCSGTSSACTGSISFGPWGSCDNSAPAITEPENCNDVDDDQNGLVDEGYTTSNCRSICRSSGFVWFGPGPVTGVCCGDDAIERPNALGQWGAEVCDGFDNNCNGIVDEGVDQNTCPPELRCDNMGGHWINNLCCGDTPNESENNTETCNGLDDNCNFLVDENHACPRYCTDGTLEGTCSTSKPYFCVDGAWLRPAAAECGCPDNMTVSGSSCIPAGLFAPAFIEEIVARPSVVRSGQAVDVRLLFSAGTPISAIQLFYRRYPVGTPQEDISLNPEDFSTPLPTMFTYTGAQRIELDGQPSDTAPLREVYTGFISDGFTEPGVYMFRAVAYGPMNQSGERVTSYSHALWVVNDGACQQIQSGGDPSQKVNVVFLPQGFNESDQSSFVSVAAQGVSHFLALPPFNGQFLDKFNSYVYTQTPSLDLGCHAGMASIDDADSSYPLLQCDDFLALSAAGLCGVPIKIALNFSTADKIVLVASDSLGSLRSNVLPLGLLSFQHLSSPSVQAFMHEFGHQFGLMDQYQGLTLGGLVTLACSESPLRWNMMCSPAFHNFEIHIKNRWNCVDREDFPEGISYCLPGQEGKDDMQYLLELLSGLP